MKRFDLNKITKVLLTLFFIVFAQYSCNDKNQVVPYVYVNFSLNIYDPEFANLVVPGNSITVTGGVNGIVIYRVSETDFVAFDRTCTYQVEENCQVQVDESGVYAVDSVCCYSKFLLLDGSVIEGPATYPLKQYNTSFNGNYLRVFN